MADTVRVHLTGGPCDGRTEDVSVAQVFQGFVVCGGQRYVLDLSTSNPVQGHLEGSAVPPAPQVAPRAQAGWNDLSAAFGVTLNRALAHSQASRNAALRKLH